MRELDLERSFCDRQSESEVSSSSSRSSWEGGVLCGVVGFGQVWYGRVCKGKVHLISERGQVQRFCVNCLGEESLVMGVVMVVVFKVFSSSQEFCHSVSLNYFKFCITFLFADIYLIWLFMFMVGVM